MITDYINLDTQEKVRYVSESSNASTSGYSTTSPGPGNGGPVGNVSPASSLFSSPAPSPATALQQEFSNMNLPSNSLQQQSPQYITLQSSPNIMYSNSNFVNFAASSMPGGAAMVTLPNSSAFGGNMHGALVMQQHQMMSNVKREYPAELRILEQPVEKFRFRYKSEMHGTHGSLNGASSKRAPKTFPEVELCNFNGRAVIRCSLFQTNLESPHSHQLVVRKDDTDICDPHELQVSPEIGYVGKFQNMGIIHTAKKYIFEELLKKKKNRLRFDLGRDELSTKQMQELHKETEKEAKEMNLNQVRLCFEAFQVDDNNSWTRIASAVYTNAINNRKSAQTGDLRICRLSIATGSVSGGDDLILLVEKVSKKNIKVRFYEMSDDDDLVWEAFARFRESDVHHQYAIVCQTPPYRDKDIDKPVEVCIELVRPSDDERSDPPITFRYKPRDVVVSRKRRRTCSSATSSSGSSVNSFELPKTLQEQTQALRQPGIQQLAAGNVPTISEEFNKDDEINRLIDNFVLPNSDELSKICVFPNNSDFSFGDMTARTDSTVGMLETDGASSASSTLNSQAMQYNKRLLLSSIATSKFPYLQRIFKIYEDTRNAKNLNADLMKASAKQVELLFKDHADKNEQSETIIHEIIVGENPKLCIKTCQILSFFKLNDLLNTMLNAQGQTGLHCACLHDRVCYVRPLLGLGCDPNIQDRKGNTALHIAVQEHHQKCIESFLNVDSGKRLDLSIRNDEGFTAIHVAVRLDNFAAAEKLLAYNRSAAMVRNTRDGNNALHMAVLKQCMRLIKFMLPGGQNDSLLTARNAAGQTALDLAKGLGTREGNEILEYLFTLCTDMLPTNLVIKEEEMSSSSTEDDDESNEALPMEQALELVKAKVKQEPIDSLEKVLNDKHKFAQLVLLLSAPEKWKKLAEKCKISHLVCVWSSAEDMLAYMRKNANSIDFNVFSHALAEADVNALQVLKSD